jgi:uncharacterized protein YbcC (UPF0753/DUF2309 family)
VNQRDRAGHRARLLAQVEEAARVVAPLWPLSSAIAVNPLWDLRQLGFRGAICRASRLLGIRGLPSPTLMAEAYAEGRITSADLRAALAWCEEQEPRDAWTEDPGSRSSRQAPVRTALERHDQARGTQVAEAVDREVAKWCGAYLAGVLADPGQEGFHAAWRAVVVHDPGARRLLGRAGRRRLAELGADAESTLATCLDLLEVPEGQRVDELARHLARLPGWAGHAKWRSWWASPDRAGPALELLDYLAVRLSYEAVYLTAPEREPARWGRQRPGHRDPEARPAATTRSETRSAAGAATVALPDDLAGRLASSSGREAGMVWLAAYEQHYRDRLLAALQRPSRVGPVEPAAQVVWCIDVRSERLRRHLEALGPYETFGFAGFFGLPMRYRGFGAAEAVDLCPVLVRPLGELAERPEDSPERIERSLAGRQLLAGARRAFDTSRKGPVAQFVLAEAGGFLAAPLALAKTVVPGRSQAVWRRVQRALAPPATTVVEVDPATGLSDEQQADLAEAALRTMGLVRRFAPVVLLCGHGSTSENNPYASALDCGACGGNRGGPSARAMAAVLNRPAVRRRLAERGIPIPPGTLFVAGEHDTATDQVVILDSQRVPPSHQQALAALQEDLERAGRAAARERMAALPGLDVEGRKAEPAQRAADWAQIRPEWGLAGNAAFIVGPREMTAGVDLGGRCFLHSYDPGVDPEGSALAAILTAPMIVAHWINAQYYFSTVDPEVLGAGDKAALNVVAGVGAQRGAGGDLAVGLPQQSLFDGQRPYHEPMRLLVVVQAPLDRLQSVIAQHEVLQELFEGCWVQLAAREHQGDPWKLYRPGGTWAPWVPAEKRSAEPAGRS